MLAALSVVAYVFVARAAHETLEPLLVLAMGQAVYANEMRHVATTIVLFDVPLVVLVGIAAYLLATISVRPLAQARAREERFAADAAHELRTPLATIATVAQAAREAPSQEQTRALETIAGVALDASQLIGDLMLLMRPAPDETRLHEPVDLAAVLDGAVNDARPRNPSVTLAYSGPAAGIYVIGDRRALRRLAGNLIENAQRHARTSVQAEIRTEGPCVLLAIEDDGEGVRPADRERIFERFVRASPEGAGTGLGLAICRHIADVHGGSIALEGAARFVARLPQAPA